MLTVLILLVVVMLLAGVGLGVAVAEGVHSSFMRSAQADALYLADAGIGDAIRSYQSNGAGNEFALGCFGNDPNDPTCDNTPNLNLGSSQVFLRPFTSPQRDFLLVDMSTQGRDARLRVRGSRTRFLGWEFRRVSSNVNLTIDSLEVRWSDPLPGENLRSVRVNGINTTVPFPGSPGQTIDIPNVTLSNDDWIGSNRVVFNGDLSNHTELVITLTFLMTDEGSCPTPDPPLPTDIPLYADLEAFRQAQLVENCRRTAVYVEGLGDQNWGLFTVRSEGEVRNAPQAIRRRLRAEFRSRATVSSQRNDIISWTEE